MATSRKQLEGTFRRLAEACGKKIATRPGEPGAWFLDADDNGYVVSEFLRGGGVDRPFGPGKKPGALFDLMVFATKAAEIARGHR